MAISPSEPKTTHLADASLRPFIQPSFDPAAYLNATLPPVHLSSTPLSQRQSGSVTVGDLATQTNQLLSQLNAQSSRLTNVLTELTDDIIRSGGRLAYEVEVLRGETLGLSETLNETLKPDVELFVSGGLSTAAKLSEEEDKPATTPQPAKDEGRTQDGPATPAEPEYMTSLRTLTRVRQRLESVITLFGEAMRWTLPSSETASIASSFLSVSAPTEPSAAKPTQTSAAQDEKARDFAETLRLEIADLIVSNPYGLARGHEAAMERVKALRDLARVWKGTAEEKPRLRFVEGLARLADERLREMEREADSGRFDPARAGTPGRAWRRGSTQGSRAQQAEKGVGFLDNLYRVRGAGGS